MNHAPLSDKQKEILNLDRELITTIIENSPELFKTKEPNLENIQIILNNTPKTAEGGIIALSTAFGDVLLKNGYDFEWMSITDEQGTDMCLKHKTISTTFFLEICL